ncbi:protein of unknown function DUF1452 [candidate division TM7 genomosp. GTL1]|nr:protein of unknown function DUF1452 [candidate division TM7 genomosp. GTL1]
MFSIALVLLLFWVASGPLLGFSDTWQLVINTSTTIITFLVVFIIQNTQNRDNLAMNIKIDAIMDKLDISEEELFKVEEETDKHLQEKKVRMQKELPTPSGTSLDQRENNESDSDSVESST